MHERVKNHLYEYGGISIELSGIYSLRINELDVVYSTETKLKEKIKVEFVQEGYIMEKRQERKKQEEE